jgi:hypothetical protein
MSMPVNTYKCTRCDLSRWDSGTWGYRYYVCRESKLRMHVDMGWCPTCNDLNAIEVLPDAEGELKYEEKLHALQAELAAMLTIPHRKRFWLFRARKSNEQWSLEHSIELTKEQLAEYQLTRAALNNRTSQARCLRCESEGGISLRAHQSPYLNPPAPVLIGFEHPGCGGQITIACDGTRLNVQLTDKAYDLEGHLVDEVEWRFIPI